MEKEKFQYFISRSVQDFIDLFQVWLKLGGKKG